MFGEEIINYGLVSLTGWFGILAILGIGKHSLNFSDKLTNYLATGSFPIYIIYQTVLVVIAYYVMTKITGLPLQFCCIAIGSFIGTIAIYEVIRRIPFIRTLFGIKARRKI